MICFQVSLRAPPPQREIELGLVPLNDAASKQSLRAKATPSKIAFEIYPLVVFKDKLINAPLALTSLCGHLSPIK